MPTDNPNPTPATPLADAIKWAAAKIEEADEQSRFAITVPKSKLRTLVDGCTTVAKERNEALDALELARVWLANCMPIGDVPGPKPLPVIDALLNRLRG